MRFEEKLKTKQYDFLNEKQLSDNIILLTLGGSHAYGTNVDTQEHTSDLDIRGIYLNSAEEILTMKCKNKPFEHKETDTVIYPLKQIVELLYNCNPNTIEILGTKDEHLFHITEEGEMLRKNVDLFLSKKAANSFGGYAVSQLRRLQNALARDNYPQAEKENHILESVKRQMLTFENTYRSLSDNKLNLYLDKSDKEDFDMEIFLDFDLTHYPLRDFKSINNEMNNIVKDYAKLNHRNSKKDEIHLNKHAMHLVRLLIMSEEILSTGKINTYRENEKEMLLEIRAGKYMKPDGTYYKEFFEMVDNLIAKTDYALEHSVLPQKPNQNKIDELIFEINLKTLKRKGML